MKLVNEEMIKKHEALRLKAYKPTPNDVWTIGWGHTRGVSPGQTISIEEAQRFFDEDVSWAVDAVNRLVKVGLTQHQFDALVSFVFNIGVTNFKTSTLLRKLNNGDYEGAANEFPKWKFQKGKVLNGLVKRRAEEMAYFLGADDTPPSPQEIDQIPGLKSLKESKEILVGSGGVIAGLAALLGSLSPGAQEILAYGVSALLVLFGAWFIYNRLEARRKGER